MTEIKLKSRTKKVCFGTKEWSENSGICNKCRLRKSCGNIKNGNNRSRH